MTFEHTPVLLAESCELLAPEGGGVFVDCTVGLGGHTQALLQGSPETHVVGLDRDPQALRHTRQRLASYGERLRLVRANYVNVEEQLVALGIHRVQGVLADLGVSSMQLDMPERGFSFRRDGPLDMRMGAEGVTAAEIVNRYSEGDMERIFREYGEERQARRIARAVVTAREDAPLETTGRLANVVRRAKRGRGREAIDPATRVFQALRIEVNQELTGLTNFLVQAVRLLDRGGRLVVISYHSLEDRIVKHKLRRYARGDVDEITGRTQAETRLIELLTTKPIRPTEAEVASNPRSRSARLRAARRL